MTGKRIRLVVGSLALLVLAAGAWLLWRLALPPAAVLPVACPSPAFLAHRANSVAAAGAALRRGFCGVEVDVQWRDRYGLVVNHDELSDHWTPEGSLSLPGLLDSIALPPPVIWLDFKNLSRGNAADAAAYLDRLITERNLVGRVIVEARDPTALWLLRRRQSGILPAYWIPPRPSGRRRLLYDARLAVIMGTLGFPAISVSKTFLTSEFAGRFRRFALFTWTCNTPEEIRAATKLGARVILSDEDPPKVAAASS